jgi:hypothetical protein
MLAVDAASSAVVCGRFSLRSNGPRSDQTGGLGSAIRRRDATVTHSTVARHRTPLPLPLLLSLSGRCSACSAVQCSAVQCRAVSCIALVDWTWPVASLSSIGCAFRPPAAAHCTALHCTHAACSPIDTERHEHEHTTNTTHSHDHSRAEPTTTGRLRRFDGDALHRTGFPVVRPSVFVWRWAAHTRPHTQSHSSLSP